MNTSSSERSAGYAGVAFAIVTFVSAFLPIMGGTFPTLDLGPGELGAALDAHRTLWLVAGWLGVPSTLFWLWFAVGMKDYLAKGPGQNEGLPAYGLAAAVGSAIVGLLGGIVASTIVFTSATELGEQLVRALFTFELLIDAGLFTFLAIYTFAVANSGRRHGTLPMWLNAIGYLSTVLSLLVTVGMVCSIPFFSLTGPLTPIAGVLFFLYILILSIVMIRNAGKQAIA